MNLQCDLLSPVQVQDIRFASRQETGAKTYSDSNLYPVLDIHPK